MASRIWPSESRYLTEETGVVVRQVACHPSLHYPPFFFVDCFDDAMRHLVFISHRTGTPQIFVEDQTRHELIQLTEKDGIAEWSLDLLCRRSIGVPSLTARWAQ